MIDYTHNIITNLDPAVLEANPLLMFEQRNISNEGFLFPVLDKNKKHVKAKSGKLLYKTTYKNAFYKGLEFKIFETGLITLSGSLHVYWNKGRHNHNDFNSTALMWVLNDIKTKFGIDPKHCVLKCLEIGINLTPSIPTNVILDNCLLHKTKPFESKKNSEEGRYIQVQHTQYIIKIYNKTLHSKAKGILINSEILRFEIKYTKMEKLNKIGIFTLQDLIDYGLHNFKKDLLTEWENVLYYDNTIQIDTLSPKTKIALLKYSNQNYWTGLLARNQNKNFAYHKKQLKKIIEKNSNKVQDLTAEIMSKKIDYLNTNTIQIDSIV